MGNRLRLLILGLWVVFDQNGVGYSSQRSAFAQARTGAPQETRAQTRQRLLNELQNISTRLHSIVVEERVEDLVPLLSYAVTVELDIEMSTAAIRQDLQSRGETYCRIFNTACARRIYGEKENRPGSATEVCRLSRCFLSARDILMTDRENLRTEVRFYTPYKEEDFDFAYITYSQAQNSRKYGWEAGVMVGLERIGTAWKICALFPLTY